MIVLGDVVGPAGQEGPVAFRCYVLGVRGCVAVRSSMGTLGEVSVLVRIRCFNIGRG